MRTKKLIIFFVGIVLMLTLVIAFLSFQEINKNGKNIKLVENMLPYKNMKKTLLQIPIRLQHIQKKYNANAVVFVIFSPKNLDYYLRILYYDGDNKNVNKLAYFHKIDTTFMQGYKDYHLTELQHYTIKSMQNEFVSYNYLKQFIFTKIPKMYIGYPVFLNGTDVLAGAIIISLPKTYNDHTNEYFNIVRNLRHNARIISAGLFSIKALWRFSNEKLAKDANKN